MARATSAAPLYFPPISIDGQSFLDGGLGINNPTAQAFREVRALNRRNPKVSWAFVSIGSGHASFNMTGSVGISSGGISGSINIVRSVFDGFTDTERIHYLMMDDAITSEIPYFRFSVPDLNMALDEWRPSTIDEITSKTNKYLCEPQVDSSLTQCADVLVLQWRSRT